MAGSTIRLNHQVNDERVRRALRQLREKRRNARPALEAIGEDLDRAHRDRFDAQVSPEGESWEPLSDAYRRRKPRRKDEILVLNGHLRDTLRYQVTDDTLEFGTDRVYGATHHFGDDDRGIPARPWLGLSEDDEREAVDTLLAHLGEPLDS